MTAEWRVLIADDEPAARRGVRLLLARHPAFTVVGECRNGREALHAVDALAPDALFLDIQMPELNGLDLVRLRAPARMPAVVFLTAHERFALPAFDMEAIDYLLKPVTEARFARAIARLSAHLTARAASTGSLVIRSPKGSLIVPLESIDWIESVDHYVRVWSGGRGRLLRESINRLEARVARHGFVRAHRGALVRVGAVRQWVHAGEEHRLVLRSGETVPVSRRRRKEVAQAFGALAPSPRVD